MPNYYELLELQPTASVQEIESALDARYDKWRRLVTHHDPNVIEEANRSLRTLEMIRGTLTDPEKRAIYDAAIGTGEHIGGLTDPDVLLQRTSSSAPPKSPPARQSSTGQDPSQPHVWICPNCAARHSTGLRHCSKCGYQIGRDCPECLQIISISDQFCPHCGVNIETFLHQKKVEGEAKLARRREEVRRQEEQRVQVEVAAKKRARRNRAIYAVGCLLVLAFFGFCCASPGLSSFFLWQPLRESGNDSDYGVVVWTGEYIEIVADLTDAHNSGFDLTLDITNQDNSEFIVTFLTSDITVSDDLGNTYPSRLTTRNIQDTLSSEEDRTYSLAYEGFIDPQATALLIHADRIGVEEDIRISVPLASLTDQLLVEFEMVPTYGTVNDVQVRMENVSNTELVLRLLASDVTLTDDLGNHYEEDSQYEERMSLLPPANNTWRASDTFSFRFVPGIDPAAKTLHFTMAMMEQEFAETFPLGIAGDGMRYEAAIGSEWTNSFRVNLRIFNVGDEFFVVRFDADTVVVRDSSGRRIPTQESGRQISIVRPGGEVRYFFDFREGLPQQGELILVFPVLCGVENVEIPIERGQ